MKKKVSTILIIIVFILGLLIALYPTISSWYNKQASSYAVATYQGEIGDKSEEEAATLLAEAEAYNETLFQNEQVFVKGEAVDETYIETLNLSNGMMGYISIDKIDVLLPIYHGTDEAVLQKGVGHLEGSSLPTGNEDSHVVLTGHTGLSSATLFTDLNQLALGDTFQISVLNETFIYEVTEIMVVEPDEVDSLAIQEGKDLVTLVTCTPYGVNSHRLLVQGERTSEEDIDDVVSEVVIYDVTQMVPMLFVIIGILIIVRVLVLKRKRRNR